MRPIEAPVHCSVSRRAEARLRAAYAHSVVPGEVVGGAWMPFGRIFVVAQTLPVQLASP